MPDDSMRPLADLGRSLLREAGEWVSGSAEDDDLTGECRDEAAALAARIRAFLGVSSDDPTSRG